jgi:hypothetical protein
MCWRSLTTKSNCQLRHKKEEKLTYLCTYAFIINQVPHVFGDSCFVGQIHKYSGKYIKRHIPTRRHEELHKGIIKRPIYPDNLGKVPPKEWPIPSQRLTMRRRWPARPARVQPHPGCTCTPAPPLGPTFIVAIQSMFLGWLYAGSPPNMPYNHP